MAKIVKIQMRRGNYAAYNESKMSSGEIAVATDTRQAFIGMGPGDAEELAFKKDIINGGGGGGSGTLDHTALLNRDAANQHPIAAIAGLQDALDNVSAGCTPSVIPADAEITDDTLLVVNPDAQPDKIPEWYSGTQIVGTGDSITAVISGSAAGDYYVNTDTFDVYHATAPDTWEYVGCIKGADGASGIHVGSEPPIGTEKIWVDPDEGFSEEFLLTAEGVAAEVDNVPTHQAVLYNSVAKSGIAKSAVTQVNFTSAENNGSYVVATPSSSDAYISVLKSGYYFLEGQVRYSHTAAPLSAFSILLKNGSTLKYGLGVFYGSNYNGYASAVTLARLNAGDKITLGYMFAATTTATGSITAATSATELHLRATYFGGV